MKRIASLALVGCLAAGAAVAAAPGGPNWIVDPAKGCGTSNPFPNPDDRIEWDGACRNGMLHGPGTLVWRQGGAEYERDEGSFVDGELDGPAVIRFPDGRAIHGSYRAGERDGPFTVVLPDGAHIRATYSDGDLVGEYRMEDREVEAWRAERAAAPPRPLTTVTGSASEVRTTVAARPAAPAAPPAVVDTGRPPRLGAPRPTVAMPSAPPPAVRGRAAPAPVIVERPRPPRIAAAAPPAPNPPIRPLPRQAPASLPTPPVYVPAPVLPPARPAAAERLGAIPIFGGGAPALRRPGADTVVIGASGRPLPPPAAAAGLRLRPPGDVLALADDLPPGQFTIDLRGASVEDAAAAVFGVLLDRPYSVAPGLGVPITLAPARPVAAAELIASFRQQLNDAGADLRRTPDGFAIVRN